MIIQYAERVSWVFTLLFIIVLVSAGENFLLSITDFMVLISLGLIVFSLRISFCYNFKNKGFYLLPELIAYNSRIPSNILKIPATRRSINAKVPAFTALIYMKFHLTD